MFVKSRLYAIMYISLCCVFLLLINTHVYAGTSNNWQWPTDYHLIQNDWPNYSSGSYHGGTDFPVALNSPVYSSCDGEVVDTQWLTYSYGRHIKIKAVVNGGDTVYIRYCHLNDIYVSVGDKVKAGQQIGISGSTGKSTGPHCHYEVRNVYDTYNPNLNPRYFLPGTEYSFETWEAEDQWPIGYVDSITGGVNSVTVKGWAYDPDNTGAQLGIHVYIGDSSHAGHTADVKVITANTYRADVNSHPLYAGCGEWHGFEATLRTSKTGNQPIYIYALNEKSDHHNPEIGSATVNITADTEQPVIEDVKVVNITESGYVISCKVTDNYGIDRVQFPTWTAKTDANGNNQDDLSGDWETNSSYSGKKVGNRYYFTVKASDHNNESGLYFTHIYAYDVGGLRKGIEGSEVTVPIKRNFVPVDIFEYGESIYAVYEDALPWTDADELCKELGGYLVSINDSNENAEIIKHIDVSNKNRYWIGLSNVNTKYKYFTWSSGEELSYTNWDTGQPDNAGDMEHYVTIWQSTNTSLWNDTNKTPYMTGDEGLFQYGFILEIKKSSIQKSKTLVLNNNKYDFYSSNIPYSIAEYYANSINGKILVIESEEEENFIESNMLDGNTWLGISDANSEGTFIDNDGNELLYTKWADGEPNNYNGNENYAVVRSSTKNWNDTKNATAANLIIKYELAADDYDINNDGSVNTSDSNLILDYDTSNTMFTEEMINKADLNSDGVVDYVDARIVLKNTK